MDWFIDYLSIVGWNFYILFSLFTIRLITYQLITFPNNWGELIPAESRFISNTIGVRLYISLLVLSTLFITNTYYYISFAVAMNLFLKNYTQRINA